MDSIEWDLCNSILSLDQEFDFTPIIPDSWFCSLNSIESDQLCCIDGAIFEEEKKMESILSACCSDMQEMNGFSCENSFLNIDDVQTHHHEDNANQILQHKRKFVGVSDDTKLDYPIKKIRASNNIRSRKCTESKGNISKQKWRKCEKEEENMNNNNNNSSCSNIIDNSSEDDNASLDNTHNNNNNNDTAAKSNTRATRGSATDPQSLYARKRRERINERLKILQTLVPNGTKVDISTMLEEAVHYVKFLQLQIKLLSSDDLWMYAPIAYNGMDIGLQQKLTSFL